MRRPIVGVLVVVAFLISGLWTHRPHAQNISGGTVNSTTLTLPEAALCSGSANNDVLCGGSSDHLPAFLANNGAALNFPVTLYSTGSYTNATTTFSTVAGLSFPVSANRNYHAYCRITWQGTANTTGPKYQFTGPAAPTAVLFSAFSWITNATFQAQSIVTAFSTPFANTGTITTATNFTDTIDLTVLNGANAGTVALQAAANGAGTLTIQNGSFCAVQ